MLAASIRVTGTVQGVGFRPTVWRIADECGLTGTVKNDAEGVLIEAWGEARALDLLIHRLRTDCPPLSIIDTIERTSMVPAREPPSEFLISRSESGRAATNVAADAATCDACLDDIRSPENRRYRYPFTNCTHCGPRLSIVQRVPYDRANTSMASFEMCPTCREEYENPRDRRFHAQPNACPACGPRAWLENANGDALADGDEDAVARCARLLLDGRIVAIKGLGGFHLACMATNANAIDTLRKRKHRYQKALAMMARDIEVIGRYAVVSDDDRRQLKARHAPIVVLPTSGQALPDGIAPGQDTVGFMLPYTPLHHLLLECIEEPVVMTSGNRSDEPQVIDNDEARRLLAGIADFFLMHDRDIVNRLDDSVMHTSASGPHLLRRARGIAPEPLILHESFADVPPVLALGGELKNTFCLLSGRRAVVSQHIGDMEDAHAAVDYLDNLNLYRHLYDFEPQRVALDCHPDYVPNKLTNGLFDTLPRIEVQHHHAHIAACMAEHGLALVHEPVLGIVLDGLGLGDDGTFWGGELLAADFSGYERLARFQPVAMPGASKAIKQPWRNAWAHLDAAFGWELVASRYADLPCIQKLQDKPVGLLAQMLQRKVNSPLGSSAGRLFDAVAALLDICPEGVAHEAQAAMELECLAGRANTDNKTQGYPLDIEHSDLPTISWRSLWTALLDDLRSGLSRETISARFHLGLARGLADIGADLARARGLSTAVLSGGVFQNRLMHYIVSVRLKDAGLTVLSPAELPSNDGGIALGQAAVAAARLQ
ncbi:MAG: carbamoyltransferase HypF [Pseudomonadota bacterium]